MSSKTLVLKFDPNTIQHLGISLYSQLPSVLSELISNSWDADTNNIKLEFFDDNDIKVLPERLFLGLTNLRSLSLGDNKITELPADLFNGLINMENLYMENNPNISTIPETLF